MKYGLSLIIFLFFSITNFAQSQNILTLEQALRLSLQNSKDLKIMDADVQQVVASVQEAKNRAYPDLKIGGSYLRLNNANVDLKIHLNTDSQQNTGSKKVSQAIYGTANLSLPLFSGNRIKNGIKAAEHLEKAVKLDAENKKDALVQLTVIGYYNLYKAQAAVRLIQSNLIQAEQRVYDFVNMERNGLLARNDLLKAELQVSNVLLALVDAESDEKIARFNLNIMLGLERDNQYQLDTTINRESEHHYSYVKWEEIALKKRADYQALIERKDAASFDVLTAKGAYYPSFILTAGYIALNVPNILTVTNAMNTGLGVQYNLADLYKNKAVVKQAKANELHFFWSVQKLNDSVRVELHEAYENYYKSLKKIEVYQQAIVQAHENYRITKNKYDNALVNTTDLLDADVSALQAEVNLEYAKADERIARSHLLEMAGVLYEELELYPEN